MPRQTPALRLLRISTRVAGIACDRSRARVLSEEDAVAREAFVHDAPRKIRIQRLAQTDNLVFDERVHRIKDERTNGCRAFLFRPLISKT